MKRVISLFGVLTVLFTVMLPFASASDLSGHATFYGYSINSAGSNQASRYASFPYPSTNGQYDTSNTSTFYTYAGNKNGINYIYLNNTENLTSNANVYVSYVAVANNLNDYKCFVNASGVPTVTAKCYTNLGIEKAGQVVNVFEFPAQSTWESRGISIAAKFRGTEAEPVGNFQLDISTDVPLFIWNDTSNTAYAYRVYSFRVITAETSEELDALDNMAQQIVEQTEILSAYMGDIVDICNSIYQRCGDLLEAQNLANQYIQALVTSVDGVKNYLPQMLSALKSVIEMESLNIQDAIRVQTETLIAYFESIQNVSDVPGDITDKTEQGDKLNEDLGSLEKPDVDTIVPEIDLSNMGSFSDVFSSLLNNNLVVTMMLISLSFALIAYVLYGKR